MRELVVFVCQLPKYTPTHSPIRLPAYLFVLTVFVHLYVYIHDNDSIVPLCTLVYGCCQEKYYGLWDPKSCQSLGLDSMLCKEAQLVFVIIRC